MVRSAWAFALVLLAAGCERFATPPARALDAGASADSGDAAPPLPLESVSIPVDGWVLHGELRPRGSGQLVVLVHQLGSNRHEWDSLVGPLTEHADGPSTLAIDLRGHGQSTEGPDGPTTWQSFGTERASWLGLVRDVQATVVWAVQHLTPRATRIVVVGSGIGASAALLASRDEAAVGAVIALSPGLGYHGLEVREAVRHLMMNRGAGLLVASEGDRVASTAVDALCSEARRGDALRVLTVPRSAARGVAMHAPGSFDLWTPVTAWLRHFEPVGAPCTLRSGEDAGVGAGSGR